MHSLHRADSWHARKGGRQNLFIKCQKTKAIIAKSTAAEASGKVLPNCEFPIALQVEECSQGSREVREPFHFQPPLSQFRSIGSDAANVDVPQKA